MLNTNFDKKVNQILNEFAPAVLAAPAIPAGISKLATTIPLLLGLGTLGGIVLGGSSKPASSTPQVKSIGPIDLGGGVTIGTPTISPTTPEEIPANAPETGEKKQGQVAPTIEEPKLNSGELTQTAGVTTAPSYSQSQAPTTTPSTQYNVSTPQQIQQQTQTSPAPAVIPPTPVTRGGTPNIPNLQRPEEAYPIDQSLTPYAMNQNYRDTSKMSPQDIWRQVFSGKTPIEQDPVEFDAPEEVLQRFKKWKQESKGRKYEAPGAFGGLMDKPY